MRILLAATVIASVSILVACSSDSTKIQAESTGPSGSGGHHTQGAGGASSSSTTGSGGNGVGAGHVITADTDSKQLVTGSFVPMGKLVDGPFVLTDIHASNVVAINLVPGASCADQSQAKTVVGSSGVNLDVHGLRIFVPAGSTLCDGYGDTGTFSGFKPY